MSDEYGIFNDEGCLEAYFYSKDEAKIASLKYIDQGENDIHVSKICPDHEEQEDSHCEICYSHDEE